jgi:hypothetical protein
MKNIIKQYWDIIGGIAASILLTIISSYELEKIQLYYSIIILTLVSIGILKIIRQAVEKQGNKRVRKRNIVDSILDGQSSVKAINLAQAPTKDGEKIGEIIIIILKGIRKIMKNLTTFFSKFKGYLLTIALAILTAVEMCGGYINEICGGTLIVNGVAILPLVTLICTIVVGILSNGYTKEQREKIKALFSKSNTNDIVQAEIKKTIKEKTAQLAQFNKLLTTQEHELENYESEISTLNNTLQAKKEMYAMIPQLATNEDVQLAANAVTECNAKIADKKNEITKTKTTIDELTTTINALKSQIV